MAFGIPSNEIKQTLENVDARLKQLEPTIRNLQQVAARHDQLAANLVLISEDVRAITQHFRELITRDA